VRNGYAQRKLAQEALNAALDAGHYLFGTRAGDESLQEQKGLPMPIFLI
jgi:hypothetical protein